MRETDGLEQTGGITGEISKIIALVSTQFQSILGLCSIRPILSVRDGILLFCRIMGSGKPQLICLSAFGNYDG